MTAQEGTVVGVAIPYPLIWGSDDVELRVNNKLFKVHFERRYRQEGDRPVFGSRLISAPGLKLHQDTTGSVAHTELNIQFPMYVRYDISHREELYEWVLEVVNRLLDVYRHASNDFYVNHIRRTELDVQRISKTLKEDGTVEERETLVGFEAGGHDRWLTQARTEHFSDDARQFLREGRALPLPQVLYLNAKREEFFENYRMAVVEAETAFEALVDQVVGESYVSSGRLSSDEVDRWLDDTGVVNLTKHHIPQCCGGEQFEGTPEHCTWLNDLYELRRGVVHDGDPVNALQAEKALEAAVQAMKWIETRAP